MTKPEFNGWQSLRMTRSLDGMVSGVLKCSVSLSLSASDSLELTDVIADVSVGSVLNPLDGVFLADEIQRLMRVGLSTWLQEELNEGTLSQVSLQVIGKSLLFTFPGLSGEPLTLRVDIPTETPQDSLVPMARERLRQWAEPIPRHPMVEWVHDEVAQADLSLAPLLQRGLAQVNAPAMAW